MNYRWSDDTTEHVYYAEEYLNYLKKCQIRNRFDEVFNMLLVLCHVRNSFMIQEVDYQKKDVFHTIVRMVEKNHCLKKSCQAGYLLHSSLILS